jgi:hypothetical protein
MTGTANQQAIAVLEATKERLIQVIAEFERHLGNPADLSNEGPEIARLAGELAAVHAAIQAINLDPA